MHEKNKLSPKADDHKAPFKKRSHYILPPPAILQAYEALSVGATARIIEMAEIEQAHRQEWEDNALKSYTKSNRIGQLLGFITSLLILVAAVYLARCGDSASSAVVAISGYSAIAITSIVSARTRRYDRRPRVVQTKA
jgi:uncharacterized membrane protein